MSPSWFFSSEIELQDNVKTTRSLGNIKTAAATIRQSLLDLDFGLDDKFCDAEELKEAWRKEVMPDVLLTFFSTLLNLRLRNLLQGIDEGSCANMDDENGSDDTDQTDMDERIESFFENQHFTKIHAMFQILFYFVHRGQKKTLPAVITGHTVYDKCRSRELITALNKVGVSTSYSEVLKNRKKTGRLCFSIIYQ